MSVCWRSVSPPKSACSSPIPTTPPPCPANRALSLACFDSSAAQALLAVRGAAHIASKAHERDCFCYCPIMHGGARQPLRGARRQLMFKNDLLKDRGIFLSGGGSGLARPRSLQFAALLAEMIIINRRAERLYQTSL